MFVVERTSDGIGIIGLLGHFESKINSDLHTKRKELLVLNMQQTVPKRAASTQIY